MLSAVESALAAGNPVKRDVHNVLSSPAPLSSSRHACGFFYGANPSHVWCSSCPAAFYLSQYYLFQTTLPFHDVPQVGQLQFVMLDSSGVSGLICSRAYLFIFLAAQGIHRPLSSNTVFLMNLFFFLSAFVTVQLSHPYIVTGNIRAFPYCPVKLI